MAGIMLWLVPVLLLVPNVALDITEQYTVLEKAVNILLPAGIYFILFSLSRRIGATILWFIPIMVLCAFQIVLLFLYGESIIAIDMFLNVVTTNVHEATELLQNLTIAIFIVCLLYLPVIITGIILCIKRTHTDTKSRHVALYTGIALAIAGVVCALCSDNYKPTRRLFPVNVISNMFSALGRTCQSDDYFDTSADFKFGATSPAPDSAAVFVLVIGETSRADNWQLNGYDRPTNPRLSQRSGLISFTRTLSESNTTHKSVPLLMSHLDSRQFGDSIYLCKGIIDAFEEAGYTTAWLSNQKRNGALIDFFGEQADTVHFITDDGHLHYDDELGPHLKNFINDNPGRRVFAVLHTYGCHFNYRERYPESYNYFRPDNSAEAKASNRPGLVNAYDNAIRYTDTVLDSIISILATSGRPAAMVYLADHGEDIFDDERGRFLHASPTPTYWQLHVPMIIWFSDIYRGINADKYARLLNNSGKDVSSSRSAFHTLISLAGIDTPYYRPDADLSSPSYLEPSRVFLNDYNEAVPLTESGLRDPDYKEFASHRIRYSLWHSRKQQF